jgi:hypothetical protein
MKTIINVPSDQEIYQVNVYYDITTNTFDIEQFRVFAFEYMSIYHTYKGDICGIKNQFLSPISLAIITDDERYEYSGIISSDGRILTYGENYDSLEKFKEDVKRRELEKNNKKSTS